MKRIAIGAAVIVVAGVLAVWLNLSHIVKSAVERNGTQSLRLQTTLDRATLSLFGGKVGLHGFGVASPRGFAAQRMLTADGVDVAVRYGDLRREPIHVESLAIDAPKLILEQSGGALNVRKAMEDLPKKEGSPMRLVIDRIDVRDAQVVIRPGLPGVQQEIAVDVPALQMKDVGRGAGAKNGAAVKDVVMQVMGALADKAAQSDQVPVEVRALLHLNAAKLAEDAARKVLSDPAAAVKDPAGALRSVLPAGRSPH